jgi:hypothetical protein
MARNDAAPVSFAGGASKVLVLVAILLVVLLFNWLESRDNCDPTVQNCSASTSRSSGGSWGGYSSGGFHK